MILVGDIGGTNARLALTEAGSTEPLQEWRVATADFSDFASVLAAYLAETGAKVTSGCLAVAGPIDDGGRSARLTNLPWTIDADVLQRRFGIGHLVLANDFAAAAMGVTVTPAEMLVPLQAGRPLADAPKLVIGAGTGLGMATLVKQGAGWRVLPGEGGHVAFSPQDDDQERVWRVLRAEVGRVTAERVVSGPGLAAIHRILAGEEADPSEIARRAASEGDATSRRSIDVFLASYGAFAGDMAMATMARGGVFLAGGIAARLLSLLPDSLFLKAFNDKAEHAALVATMPVATAVDPALGLRGAACLSTGDA